MPTGTAHAATPAPPRGGPAATSHQTRLSSLGRSAAIMRVGFPRNAAGATSMAPAESAAPKEAPLQCAVTTLNDAVLLVSKVLTPEP